MFLLKHFSQSACQLFSSQPLCFYQILGRVILSEVFGAKNPISLAHEKCGSSQAHGILRRGLLRMTNNLDKPSVHPVKTFVHPDGVSVHHDNPLTLTLSPGRGNNPLLPVWEKGRG
jgi:hypothetical protein